MDEVLVEDVKLDTPPSDVAQAEYPCRVCGQEAGPYGGRGRKPTLCSEHKAAKSGSPRSKTVGKNAALAGQAADTLVQYNGLVALVATLARYPMTGEAIRTSHETFREEAYQALLTDPALCQSIVRTGGLSGRAALIVSYGMLVSVVAPITAMEHRQHKAEKQERLDAEDHL